MNWINIHPQTRGNDRTANLSVATEQKTFFSVTGNASILPFGETSCVMSRRQQSEFVSFRGDYAKGADFCQVFQRDMKSLYLLTFLLTANHNEAARCFGLLLEDAFKENCVFQGWIGYWLRRCVIRKAIQAVFSCSVQRDKRRDLWWNLPGEQGVSSVLNAVSSLEDPERFVYVMSILEGYSNKDCSLLLNCNVKTIVELQISAACKLAAHDPFVLRRLARPSDRRESA
jgi:hypothetical protein